MRVWGGGRGGREREEHDVCIMNVGYLEVVALGQSTRDDSIAGILDLGSVDFSQVQRQASEFHQVLISVLLT
jgi:hypothetical protein